VSLPPDRHDDGSGREPTLTGRVVRAQSGFYEVATPDGVVTAVLRGRMKRDRRAEGLVVLGDLVRLERLPQPEGDGGRVTAAIDERLPRETVLVRRAPGPKGAWSQDVVVANIDQLLPTFAVRQPDPSPRMIDRFLALAEMDHVEAVVVLTKVDLGTPPSVRDLARELEGIGYPVVLASAVTGEGIGALRERLAGRVSAVVGPSGAGKSSLLNAIDPGLGLAVGAIGDAVGKGRHTTRVGVLHALPSGGLVADTPGLREIGIWAVNPADLELGFREFRPYLDLCRFNDCSHVHEPGCAVRAAVEAGEIPPRRYESYVAMLGDP